MTLVSKAVTDLRMALTNHHNTIPLVRNRAIRAKVMMPKVDQEISTTHQVKSCDTSPSSHTTTTSMEIRDSSTHSSRSTKLNSASISLSTVDVHLLNIVSLHMVKKILDKQAM